ncbi:cdc42 effector protein 3-like [Hyla sarda]|uniref:cdc42 effector protein 3-like n=1 Tax=Hyla sarda TaxID=327740 RepID=UPI0024C2E361|nr:cdc42 effector protein 3-like [Hyla sarda]XP_056395929.1 cdc42 effector protein 3-like [Hyla sarda]
MPAKTPMYLKTSTPKRGKKLKLRDVLSREMISPPLGDFRHSAHIGLDGEEDMFGELSFLQGKYDLIPNSGRKLTLQNTDNSQEFHDGDGSFRPFLKNAVSLPVFTGTQSKERAPPKPPRLHLEEVPSQRSMSISYGEGCFRREEDMSFSSISKEESSRFLTPSASSSEGSITGSGMFSPGYGTNVSQSKMDNTDSQNQENPPSESLFGLELDLGPSILDDVLRIMDDYKAS